MPTPPSTTQAEPQAGEGQSQEASSRQGPTVRFRASKACRRCNEKRVKCDASERGIPCTRCEERQEPDCRLIQSRRGIYDRKARHRSSANGNAKDRNPNRNNPNGESRQPEIESDGRLAATLAWTPTSMAPLYPQQQVSEVPSHPNGSSTPTASPDEAQNDAPSNAAHNAHNQQRNQPRQPSRNTVDRDAAHGLAEEPSPEHDTPCASTDTNASSYREISWAAMFDHLLDGQQRGEDVVDKCSITYLGESFPLAIVLKDLKRGGRPQLHHPGLPCPPNEEHLESQNPRHPPYMLPEEIEFLEAKKAFDSPDKETLDALISVFLDRVFPLYPIINRQEFLQQHNSKRIPWILLHAICFIAATFCPLHVLLRGGFESRRQARWMFYSKAKALFDVGYEGNKIVVLQVSIMMSFWGGGPNNYWNFYSWISTGVTLAETLGCHRSMAGTNIKPQDRSLLKRLWWILVIRDTLCAALVGRPFRVNLEHCDIDALTLDDFQHDASSPEFAASPYAPSFGHYQIQATKLAVILRRIITTRYYPPGGNSLGPSLLKQRLTEWRAQLPPQLEWSDTLPNHSNIFTSTLSIIYNHHLILACLNSRAAEPAPPGAYSEQSFAEEISSGAAQQIASTACAVVTKSDILLAPHELHHGIFTAAVIFYMQTKSITPLTAQLGMSGLTNCRMVLHECRDSWDPSPWITQLFDKVLCSPPTHQHSSEQEPLFNGCTSMSVDNGACVSNNIDPGGVFSTGYDMWQSHPVLENLFDNLPAGPFLPATPGFGGRSDNVSWFNA